MHRLAPWAATALRNGHRRWMRNAGDRSGACRKLAMTSPSCDRSRRFPPRETEHETEQPAKRPDHDKEFDLSPRLAKRSAFAGLVCFVSIRGRRNGVHLRSNSPPRFGGRGALGSWRALVRRASPTSRRVARCRWRTGWRASWIDGRNGRCMAPTTTSCSRTRNQAARSTARSSRAASRPRASRPGAARPIP